MYHEPRDAGVPLVAGQHKVPLGEAGFHTPSPQLGRGSSGATVGAEANTVIRRLSMSSEADALSPPMTPTVCETRSVIVVGDTPPATPATQTQLATLEQEQTPQALRDQQGTFEADPTTPADQPGSGAPPTPAPADQPGSGAEATLPAPANGPPTPPPAEQPEGRVEAEPKGQQTPPPADQPGSGAQGADHKGQQTSPAHQPGPGDSTSTKAPTQPLAPTEPLAETPGTAAKPVHAATGPANNTARTDAGGPSVRPAGTAQATTVTKQTKPKETSSYSDGSYWKTLACILLWVCDS